MAYLALYRKYRPSNFEGVIGQEHVIQTLANQIIYKRLGHAYLFTGSRGTGKTSIAKIFAKAINCQNPINGSPCGECSCCRALSDPSNIDIIEIDAASNNGVNEIRDIKENVQYPPVSCKYKVYIIDEVHMLSGPAFNALLKTLEEPPKHAVFILATTEVHKIPATILSRCMRFDFRLVSTERIAKLIEDVYVKEGKDFEKEAVFAIAKAGEGSVRDALSIADIALSCSDKKLTYDNVMMVLGSTNMELIEDLIKNVLLQNCGKVLETVNNLITLGKSIGVIVKDINTVLRDLIIIKTCANPNQILGLPEDRINSLSEISNICDNNRILRCMEIFSEISTNLRYSNHPRILFETALLKASKPDADYDINAILSRLSVLEQKIANGDIVVNSKENNNKQTIVKQETKKEISELSERQVKAQLMSGLKANKNEFLLSVIENLNLQIINNQIVINTVTDGDFELLSTSESKAKIINALSDYKDISIEIKMPKGSENLKEIDEATDKIKQIFGDDIVIINE